MFEPSQSQGDPGHGYDSIQLFGSLVASAGDFIHLCCTFRRLLALLGARSTRLDFFNSNNTSFTTFHPAGTAEHRFERLESRPLKGSNWSVERVFRSKIAFLGIGLARHRQEAPEDYKELVRQCHQVGAPPMGCLSVPIKKGNCVIGVITMVDTDVKLQSNYMLSHVDMLVTLFGSLLPDHIIGDLCSMVWEMERSEELGVVVRSSLELLWKKFPVVGLNLAVFECRKKVAVVFGLKERSSGDLELLSDQGAFGLDSQATAVSKMLFHPGLLFIGCDENLERMKDVQMVKRANPDAKVVLVVPLISRSEPNETPNGSQQGLVLGIGCRSGWESLCGAIYIAGPRRSLFDSCQGMIECCSMLISWKLEEKLQESGISLDLQKLASRAQDQIGKEPIAGEDALESVEKYTAQLQKHLAENRKSGKLQLLRTLQIGSCLGEGTFGLVFNCKWQGAKAAMKIFRGARDGIASLDTSLKLETEVGLMSVLHHPNIVSTYTYMLDVAYKQILDLAKLQNEPASQGRTMVTEEQRHELSDILARKWPDVKVPATRWNILVMEHCDHQSLEEEIQKEGSAFRGQDGRINIRTWLSTACEIAYALRHLHSQNIIHGDLKSGNILLSSSANSFKGFTVKVSDFGTSRILDGGRAQLDGAHGTLAYMPPEVIGTLNGIFSVKLDVYSFGIILWEMSSGVAPYKNMNSSHIRSSVCYNNYRPIFDRDFPRDYAGLAKQCWAAEVPKRPTFEEIVRILEKMKSRLGVPD